MPSFALFFVPVLCALQQGAPVAAGGSHSLCINFTIAVRNRAGSQWCDAVVQAGRQLLFNYTCENHKRPDSWLIPLCPLGEEVDARERGMLSGTLKDLMEELKMEMPNLQLKIPTNRGPLSLQGSIQYQAGVNGSTVELKLSFQGEEVINFEWTHLGLKVHSANKSVEEEWKDKVVTKLLQKIPGEFEMLIDNISEVRNKMPQTTALTMAPGRVPVPVPSSATATLTGSSASPFIWILTCAIVFGTMFMPVLC